MQKIHTVHFRIPRCLPLSVLLCLTLSGCGGDKAARMYSKAFDSNIKTVSNLYCIYQGRHRQKGPEDEAELKDFVRQLPAEYLEKFGVDLEQLDELFVSPRDGQPFDIRWGLKFQIPQAPMPIVFEKEGVDGKYEVGFSSFIVKEVDKQEYDKLWSEKSKAIVNTRGAR